MYTFNDEECSGLRSERPLCNQKTTGLFACLPAYRMLAVEQRGRLTL